MEIQVSGWRYPRTASLEGNTLVMEVAREACRHCPTCSARVETVEEALRRNGPNWRWFSRQGGLYVAVNLPERTNGVADYLTNLLGRQVSVYA